MCVCKIGRNGRRSSACTSTHTQHKLIQRENHKYYTLATTQTKYHIVENFGEVFNMAIWRIRYTSPN